MSSNPRKGGGQVANPEPYEPPKVEEIADGDYPISTAAGTSILQ